MLLPGTLSTGSETAGSMFGSTGSVLAQIVAVGIGGGLGAIARFAVGQAVRSMAYPPWSGTLVVNLLGCYGIGVAFVALETHSTPPWLRALFITGLLGAFTTFSTFSLESMQLLERRAFGHLALNISLSIIIGFVAVHLGLLTGQRLLPQQTTQPEAPGAIHPLADDEDAG